MAPPLATSSAHGLSLLAHHDLGGRGDGMQVLREGDVLYVAHNGTSGAGTSILDVADPAHPKLVRQWDAPANTHTHKVQIADGLLLTRPYVFSISGSLIPLLAGGAVLAGITAFAVHRLRRRRDGPGHLPRRVPALAARAVALVGVLLAPVPFVGWVFALAAAAAWLLLAIGSLNGGIHVNRGEPHVYRLNTRLYDRLAERWEQRRG